MHGLKTTLTWISSITILLFALIVLRVIYDIIKEIAGKIFKKDYKFNLKNKLSDLFYDLIKVFKGNKFFTIFISSGIIWSIISIIPYTDLGSTTIGSIIEKNEYSEKYYVNMFPDKEDIKNYKVEALIISYMEEYEDIYSERTYIGRVYYIEEAYMENGNKITFYDEMYNGCSLEINQKKYVVDDSGKEWYIELTNQKVND